MRPNAKPARTEKDRPDDQADREGGRRAESKRLHLPVQMVPAGFSTGTPTALPYSVHEPS